MKQISASEDRVPESAKEGTMEEPDYGGKLTRKRRSGDIQRKEEIINQTETFLL
jgi:hypothetical protein